MQSLHRNSPPFALTNRAERCTAEFHSKYIKKKYLQRLHSHEGPFDVDCCCTVITCSVVYCCFAVAITRSVRSLLAAKNIRVL